MSDQTKLVEETGGMNHRALPEEIGRSSDADTDRVFKSTLWTVGIIMVALLWVETVWNILPHR